MHKAKIKSQWQMQDNKHGGDTQKCHINHGENEQKKKTINSATIYKQKKQDGNQE